MLPDKINTQPNAAKPMMKCLSNRLLFILLLIIFLFCGKNKGLAAEFDYDYDSPLLSQFATYVVERLSDSICGGEAEMTENAKRIDHGATQEVTLKRIRLFRDILVALEGSDLSKVELKCVSSPEIIRVSGDLEVSMLVYFSVTGRRVHSGLLTVKVIQPSLVHGSQIVVGGLQIGHIAVSESKFGE